MKSLLFTMAVVCMMIVQTKCSTLSVAPQRSPFVDLQESVGKNIKRLINGVTQVVPNFLEAERLKKLQKKEGLSSITFSQFKFLEQAKDDMGKWFRVVITIPLSTELFFYSYIIIPMATNNAWAWRSLPSVFDSDPNDLKIRESSIVTRRHQAVVNALSSLKSETAEDMNKESRENKLKQLELIEKALKSKSMKDALEVLQPWLWSDRKASSKLFLPNIPGSIVKDWCRGIGVDGMPNWPLIQRLNRGELSQYFEKVRASDDFISAKGIQSLNKDELRRACIERAILTESRDENKLRQDLREWLDITMEPAVAQGSDPKAPLLNPQNRRMALMGLHAARTFRASKTNNVYKLLLEGN